jgi:hypothetical protein
MPSFLRPEHTAQGLEHGRMDGQFRVLIFASAILMGFQ